MFIVFEDRTSDSPFVERVWRCHSERAGTFEAALHGDRAALSRRSVERHFLQSTGMTRGTFQQIGVLPQFEKIAEYKSAPEQFTQTGPSEAATKMNNDIFDGLWEHDQSGNWMQS